jgi:hypothetical protein
MITFKIINNFNKTYIMSNTVPFGRWHTHWLNFMYHIFSYPKWLITCYHMHLKSIITIQMVEGWFKLKSSLLHSTYQQHLELLVIRSSNHWKNHMNTQWVKGNRNQSQVLLAELKSSISYQSLQKQKSLSKLDIPSTQMYMCSSAANPHIVGAPPNDIASTCTLNIPVCVLPFLCITTDSMLRQQDILQTHFWYQNLLIKTFLTQQWHPL